MQELFREKDYNDSQRRRRSRRSNQRDVIPVYRSVLKTSHRRQTKISGGGGG